ncbi:uncharacterized protein LOC117296630 [Asterias rubens]|uniref:uncharacterized protein LOC117296630 n=1 Tax=Asterias rubens TaxID=7604 RepID=UPI0014553E06|nr:uncharacterized protein LOC117296630 [Asterias rubens]
MGDIAMDAAILFSGSQHAKVHMMCTFMNLGCPGSTQFFQVQRLYVVPAVDELWTSIEQKTIESRQDKDLVICGDTRNDSPGFSAKYCTYTMLDEADDSILRMGFKDKRECGGKSPNMETDAFVEALDDLQRKLKVVEVCTDSSSSITKKMREKYNGLKHSYDVWHAAKNLSKKLTKAAQKAGNRELLRWTSDIVTHFWRCAELSHGNAKTFLMRWRGILHHVTGVHQWVSTLGEGYGPVTCEHGSLRS